MELISGTKIASEIYENLGLRIESLGKLPHIQIIRANTDSASASFVELKVRAAEKLGIKATVHEVPADYDFQRLQLLIQDVCKTDPESGVMLQLPLYTHLQQFRAELLNLIPAEQDVDGLGAVNQGLLVLDSAKGLLPATVKAVKLCLESVSDSDLAGKHAVIINHSSLIGRPLSSVLLAKRATVSIVHEFTRSLTEFAQTADILISAAGQPGLLDSSDIKEGAILIDVTSVRDKTGVILGDVKTSPELDLKVAARTPVPGGVGPATVACLLENLVELYEARS